MASARAHAHANPLRDRLLFEYATRESTPSELARRLRRPVNLVSYHTSVLVDQGFLELVRTERRRGGTAHVYRAAATSIIENDAWDEVPTTVRRMLVRGLLTIVGVDSQQRALAGGFDGAESHLGRWALQLDEPARQAIAELLRGLLAELAAIQAAADARSGARRRRVDVVLMGFPLATAGA